jgi:hypothetical protein
MTSQPAGTKSSTLSRILEVFASASFGAAMRMGMPLGRPPLYSAWSHRAQPKR